MWFSRSCNPTTSVNNACPYRILVIDDDPAIVRSLELLLRAKGYIVATAGDGPGGLKAFHAFAPQIVISDVFVPGIEGLEVIRQINQQNQDVMIVAMSGCVAIEGYDLLEHARAAGATVCISKPFEIKELFDALRLFPKPALQRTEITP